MKLSKGRCNLKLLNVDKNNKTVKGQKHGYITGILYLAPASESEVINVCKYSTPGCRKGCLYTSGHGAYQRTKDSRIKKTVWFHLRKESFIEQLVSDISALKRKAKRGNFIPVVRLNGTSDIEWEKIKFSISNPDNKVIIHNGSLSRNIFDWFSDIQFYDYTKNPNRYERKLPSNYHLTFSRDETNRTSAGKLLAQNYNVAVVLDKIPTDEDFPYDEILGSEPEQIVNGDLHDLRFTDLPGSLVLLKAKGKARKDTSGFVVETKLLEYASQPNLKF